MATMKITEKDALTRLLKAARAEPGYVAVARIEGRAANRRKKERQVGRVDCPEPALLKRVGWIFRDAVPPGGSAQLRVRRYDAEGNKTEQLVTVTRPREATIRDRLRPARSEAEGAVEKPVSRAPEIDTAKGREPAPRVADATPARGTNTASSPEMPPPALPSTTKGAPPAVAAPPTAPPIAPAQTELLALQTEIARLQGELARRDGEIARRDAENLRLQAKLTRANDALIRSKEQRGVLRERLAAVKAERDEHAAEVVDLRRVVRRHEREAEQVVEQMVELEEMLPRVGFGWGR